MSFKRNKSLGLSATLAGLILAAIPAAAQEGVPKITIMGEGRVEATPDLAVLSLGVETRAATASEAMDANSKALAAVLERFKAQGIEGRDLQTSGFSLNPQMDYSKADAAPKLVGYHVSNQLTVRVRDLDKLGGVMDQAVKDGANSFNGLSFLLADSQAVRDEARKRAVADARRQAELLAEAAGVTLGPILSIENRSQGTPVMPMARASMALAEAAPAPVERGEVSYSAAVEITWSLITK